MRNSAFVEVHKCGGNLSGNVELLFISELFPGYVAQNIGFTYVKSVSLSKQKVGPPFPIST